MQQLEEEIKELQSHLGTVVRALGFLQTFLESDYGLKYQFHAYCNSPLYAQYSGVLEVIKEKFPLENAQGSRGNEIGYSDDDDGRRNDAQFVSDLSPMENDNSSSRQYSGQGTVSELQTITKTVPEASECVLPDNREDESDYVRLDDQLGGTMIPTVIQNISSQRLPLIVDEEELFEIGVTDHARIKIESQHYFEESNVLVVNEHDSGEELENVGNSTARKVAETPSRKSLGKKKRKGGLQCTHCRRRCPDEAQLELHMRHHKQQFQCSECGVWLADKAVLNRHMRTHTGDRPYRCMFCKEAFSRQDIVKKHIVRKHKEMIGKSQIMKKSYTVSNVSENS